MPRLIAKPGLLRKSFMKVCF